MNIINQKFLEKIMPKFKAWLETDLGQLFSSDRAEKDEFFSTHFAANEIEKIDEGILREFLSLLWSYAIWTNKDWLLNQMLQSGLAKIKKSFKNLLYSEKGLAERFDQMRSINFVGAATISEILVHHDSSQYPIWNRRAKSSLIKLGINPASLPKASQINGSQYEDYIRLVKPAFKEVQQKYPEINDLLKFDFLLYYISAQIEEKIFEPKEKFDHSTTIEQLLQLGDSLGFEINKEVKVTSGCQIDAVWRSRIANLGMITYAFEVQKSGSRDSAILNLQRISNADPTVQKVVFVAIDSEIEKIKAEIATLHEEFRNSVGYFRVEDLQEALVHQEAVKSILASIGLMKTKTVP